MSDLLLIAVSFLLFLMRYFFKLCSILTESIKTLIQTTIFCFLIWLLKHGLINRLSLDPWLKCWHLGLTGGFLAINVLSPWLSMNSTSRSRWLNPHKGHTIRFIELLFSFMVDMLDSWLLISCIERLMIIILIIRKQKLTYHVIQLVYIQLRKEHLVRLMMLISTANQFHDSILRLMRFPIEDCSGLRNWISFWWLLAKQISSFEVEGLNKNALFPLISRLRLH
jgi:hypothetical protein